MNKWTKAAKKVKERWNQREEQATDMEILIERIMALPLGQLKKLLSDDVKEILRKYGVEV